MLPPKDLGLFRRSLLRWYHLHGRDLPWRRTRDPYAILVSELMLQQTQVATVLPYYRDWLQRFPDFASLARASENDVLHAWQGLGYYSRARNFRAAAKIVQDRHTGILPRDPHSIRNLPGIGRYTANAVATFAFDQSVPVVEANISRLLARVLNIAAPIDSARGRDKLWAAARSLVPKQNPGRFNSALMDLGALICLPRNPKCGICPVREFCRAPNPELLPRKKPRLKTRRLTEDHAFTIRRDEILLEQATTRWRGMWMLPPIKTNRTDRPIHRSIFPFTHHRITLRLFRRRTRQIDTQTQRWVTISDLSSIAMPTPHRRAIAQRLGFDLAATPLDLKNRS